MRSVSVQELEEHIPDLQAGETLTLVHGGKAVATITPTEEQQYLLPPGPERDAAIAELMAMLRNGWDFKGYKFNRAELYDDAI